ncbi:uncharacterized protein EV154DRAFT_488353 [Mucor mucedo]|uniref:uncharacterized protein n=1 Tax=Mucor mucedo TaxID=29922 RepID=UPI002220F75C|nr:uncharacterized protein EV154DRAFT_488353 [Mucor mucedo]KAI7867328.1 hypothetical protein EV154DRAFT_488353 [Mucor mucedo]
MVQAMVPTVNNRLEFTRTLAERNALYRALFHSFNTNNSTKGRRPLSASWSNCSALRAGFRHRNDRFNATGTAPIENWVYHDAIENPTIEMPTVIPHTVYTSLAGETIDNRGEVAGARGVRAVKNDGAGEGRAVNRTIEHLVTSMNEVEARRFEHGEPERRMFTEYLALSTTFFGQMLKSMEKRDKVQSRIAK